MAKGKSSEIASQKLDECPGWNHEIAIGWRSKNTGKNEMTPFSVVSGVLLLMMMVNLGFVKQGEATFFFRKLCCCLSYNLLKSERNLFLESICASQQVCPSSQEGPFLLSFT